MADSVMLPRISGIMSTYDTCDGMKREFEIFDIGSGGPEVWCLRVTISGDLIKDGTKKKYVNREAVFLRTNEMRELVRFWKELEGRMR